MSQKAQWVEFGDYILKSKNIDYFKISEDGLTISCLNHVGMSYDTAIEKYMSPEHVLNRFKTLSLLLQRNNKDEK